VPADVAELASGGILSAAGVSRARQDLTEPGSEPDGDVSVTSRVGGRFGAEVVDRLVEPLLGGVYAGRTEDLSFEATLGPLAAAAARFPTLGEAVASLLPHAPPAPPVPPQSAPPPQPGDMPTPAMSGSPTPAAPPVFTTLAGGLGTLPAVLAAASGAVIRTKATVRELTRANDGRWRLTIGPASAPEHLEADAVILALPARPASRLLAGPAPAAAAALAEISYASMAIITLAYPQDAFPAAPSGSGFLVPAVDGHAVKAVTFSTVKWPHLRAPGSLHIVRCSVGRLGDEAVLQRDDADLASLAAADLAVATGVRGRPADTRVTRWGGGLPQYSVGHLGRVTRIRAGVAEHPGLAVCGAAYDGVGIPACVASAQTAADRVIAHLSSRQKLRSS
jgi:oxygen-dependent protoporphyrinogen oxidase